MVWKAKKGDERDGGVADKRVKSRRRSGSWARVIVVVRADAEWR